MVFADKYLQKNNRKVLIPANPNANCGLRVVIPCFNEPDILQTLESIYSCQTAEAGTEVIVVINHSGNASKEIRLQNAKTKLETDNWISKHRKEKLDFFVIGPVELPEKWAGAGLARKLGMDEAVRRFNLLEKPGGIIVSLDADTLVDNNYLAEIENHFSKNPKQVGATIGFKHQTDGLSQKHLEGILLYEKYMRYYKSALDFAGYPYPMFTVGSAFAVIAGAYVKRGGMNRRKAGEDFYFLQNLVQLGPVGEITTTTVYPSARLSDRVPFGTGPVLKKWMNNEEDLSLTYNFQAFADLKLFFEIKKEFFGATMEIYNQIIKEIPDAVKYFVVNDNFWLDIEDLNRNCSSLNTFQNRFFQKFNAFKILKYLNFVHPGFYKKKNLEEQYALLKLNMNTK